MIIDAHLHCSGRENDGDVLRALDDADVDVGVLLAPFLDPPYRYDDRSLLHDIQRLLKEPLEHVRVEGFEAPHASTPSNALRPPRPQHRPFRPRGYAPQRRHGASRPASRPRAASYR